MTKTNIVLKPKKMDFSQIKEGTLLKKGNDLFVLALIQGDEREEEVDPIIDAIFGDGRNDYSMRQYQHKGDSRRYSLISISRGISYYNSPKSMWRLKDLLKRENGFQIVDSVEITEI